MIMRRLLTCAVFFAVSLTLTAQDFRFHPYRVEQGLPSDVIKAATQDSLGYIWIATDDGLVKYDGLRFTTYKQAFRSQYVKGFLHTREGKLLAFGDLDVIEITNRIDTVIFRQVLKGERFFSDSAMWFPKSIYQDTNGYIWLGEPHSVIRYDGSNIKRFDFGEENRSSVYTRSFAFFEDQFKTLYVISYNGSVFRYSQAQEKFLPIDHVKFPSDISCVLYYKNNLLIGARDGLFSAQVTLSGIKAPRNIFPVRHVSHLTLLPDSSVLASTFEEDLYTLRFTPDLQWESMYHNFNGINNTFYSNEGDIWVSSDKGLVLVQKNLFVLNDVASQMHFVEGIAQDLESGSVYYCSKETLIKLDPLPGDEWKRTVLYDDKDNYFQALQFRDGVLWAASSWRVMRFLDGKLQDEWDFAPYGNFVHDVFLDSENMLWISQAGTDKIRAITDQDIVLEFEVEGLGKNEINIIREGKTGIYAVGSGNDSYLYYKSYEDQQFINVSHQLPFPIRGDLNVVDMAIDHNDVVWLASSEGLLRWDRNSVTRISFGEAFEQYPVSSVEILNHENLLFANSYGLFRYNIKTGEYWLYDENTGLPSNTITDHGIFVNNDKKVWVGTSYGLAYAKGSLLQNKVTPTPYCVEAHVNGVPARFVNGLFADHGAFITMRFSPISFPENKINLQWKFRGDTVWRAMENQQLSLSGLQEGPHVVLVRAKKNTGYSWSDPSAIVISMAPPYWKRTEFVLSVFTVILLVAWASYAISSVILSRRRRYLELVINERTHELQKANEELIVRNAELDRFVYSASHDLSAPLKSILGLIRVAKMDEPGEAHVQYLDMMERSVNKLEMFIQEVVTYSRNTRMPVKYERFRFREFVECLLADHEFSPNFGLIRFIIDDGLKGEMISDTTRMKIILNNLISNAIKFHWIDDDRKPFIRISVHQQNDVYRLIVEDNGKGISEVHIGRIFEMFYRATDETQGSGLGLYILKESVAKLGGTVTARSRLAEGTTFEILLPIPDDRQITGV